MASEGKLPWLKIRAKRITPDKVKHPTTGMSIPCANQAKGWDGQYTEAEIESMVQDYFGGGKITVNALNPADDMKIYFRRTYDFPGDPNTSNVLSDCMTTQLAENMGLPHPSATSPTGAPPLIPGPFVANDPVKQVEAEARLADAEAKKMEIEVEAQSRKLEAQRKLRRMKQKAEQDEQQERFEQEEGFAFDAPGGPSMLPVPRPGAGRFLGRRFLPEPPLPEMDQPITTKDMMVREQISEMREQNRRLEERLERTMEKLADQGNKPKADTKEMLVAALAAVSPIVAQLIQVQAQNAQAQRQSTENFMKLMLDSGNKTEKTMEMVMQAIGIRDNRESKSNEQMIELIKLGAEMGGSGGEESMITQVGRAGADILGGIVSAFQTARAPGVAPQMAAPRPVPALPAPRPNVPLPGHSAAAPRAASLPPPPVVQPAPVHQALPVPGASASQAAPAAPASAQEPQDVTNADLRKLAERLLDEVASEVESLPKEPKWVETAFSDLPNDWIEAIAQAGSYRDLIEMVKPLVPTHKLIGLLPLVNKPGVVPWLEMGFEELQAECRRELSGENDPDPNEGKEPVPEEPIGKEEPTT